MAPAECVTDAKANHVVVVVVVVVVFTLVQVSSLAPPSPSAALVAASAVDRGTDDEGAMGSGGGAAGSVAKSSDGSGSEGIDGESVVPLANDEPIVPLGNDSGTMRMLQFKAQFKGASFFFRPLDLPHSDACGAAYRFNPMNGLRKKQIKKLILRFLT